MRRRAAPALVALAAAAAAAPAVAGPLPPPPAGWPGTLELGLTDAPGGAAGLAASVPVRFRYQYLAGGVNTGQGWAGWNPAGTFVSRYVRESRAAGLIPVFTYYQIRQSKPGADMDETQGVLANLRDPAVMRDWFADLTLAMRRARGAGGTVVLHVEPDMWGYLQQAARAGDPRTVRVAVGATGLPALRALPDTAAGLGRAVLRLRARTAPRLVLADHMSVWGTRVDVGLQDPSPAAVDTLARRSARFHRALGSFDLTFTDVADRDAGFRRVVLGDAGRSWWTPADFARSLRFLAGFVRMAGRRVVVWQVPLGNTLMRAMDDSWGHFRDNRVQTWLGDPAGPAVRGLRDAGVAALLFGGGADGTTCACDARGDGVTDPATAGRPSLSADDDGGFFRDRVRAHARAGTLPLVPGAQAGALLRR